MLRPPKHSNPDKTVLTVAAIILSRLMRYRAVSYDDLYGLVKGKFVGADTLFIPSLSFLYALGRIEYRAKTDMFEYIEHFE